MRNSSFYRAQGAWLIFPACQVSSSSAKLYKQKGVPKGKQGKGLFDWICAFFSPPPQNLERNTVCMWWQPSYVATESQATSALQARISVFLFPFQVPGAWRTLWISFGLERQWLQLSSSLNTTVTSSNSNTSPLKLEMLPLAFPPSEHKSESSPFIQHQGTDGSEALLPA